MRLRDLKGQSFGKLMVIDRAEVDKSGVWWNCSCDCGEIKAIRGQSLTSGDTKSCGCHSVKFRTPLNTTHGEASNTPEWSAWQNMKQRCLCHTHKSYRNYGGRGIKVSKEWTDSYIRFLMDMGRRPTPKHSLDRIDNNGDYEPGNCRWTTTSMQSNNKSNNKIIKYRGVTRTLGQWSNIFSIKRKMLYARLCRGWDIEKTLNQPKMR